MKSESYLRIRVTTVLMLMVFAVCMAVVRGTEVQATELESSFYGYVGVNKYMFDANSQTATLMTCYDEGPEVIIPGTVVYEDVEYKVTQIAAYAFGIDDVIGKITSITIPENVTEMQSGACSGCTALKEVKLPSTLTNIGNRVFQDCTSLTTIVIPENTTKLGSSVFTGCDNLESIYYSPTVKDELSDAGATDVGLQVEYETNEDGTIDLTVVQCPEDADSITLPNEIGGKQVNDVELPEGVDVPIKCISHGTDAFRYDVHGHWYECSVCEKVAHTFVDGNTACECGYVPFTYEEDIEEISLAVGYTEETILTVSVTPTLGVEAIAYQWYEADKEISGATGATFKVETGKEVGEYSFTCKITCGDYSKVCKVATVMVAKKKITAWVDNAERYVGQDNPTFTYTVPEGTLINGDTTADWKVNLTTPATKDSPAGTYEIMGTITSDKYEVTVTPGVLTVKAIAKKGAKIIDATGKATYKVVNAGTFDEVANVVSGATVEYIKPVNKNAKSVTIPATIKVNGITYKVTSIANKAFKDNKKLTTVKIGTSVKTIGKEAFSGCKNLKTVKSGKNVATIGDKAFYNCGKLTSITIPSKVSKIGKSAFEKCKKLKTVTIKTKKLTTKKVGAKAFKGIKSNVTIKVPKKKYKAYKTMLKKKGVCKQARYKKI